MTHSRRPALAAALLLVGPLAAGAWAQHQDAAPLQGPKVQGRDIPGVQAPYVPGAVRGLGMMERPVPPRVYFDAIRALNSVDAPPETRLTAAQEEELRAEVRRFAADVRAYLESVRPEVDTLLEHLPLAERRRIERELAAVKRNARGMGLAMEPGEDAPEVEADQPDARADTAARTPRESAEAFRLRFRDHAPPPAGEADETLEMQEMIEDSGPSPEAAVRARLREIRDAAPAQTELQTRVWRLLTEAQRERVGGEIGAYQASARDRAQEQRLQRQLAQRRQDAPLAPEADSPAPPQELDEAAIERLVGAVRAGEFPEPLWSRLPDRARERLESLPAEERARALERFLRARMQRASTRG